MALLLDIRTKQEYEEYHLPGAILVPTPLPPLTAQVYSNLGFQLVNVVSGVSPDTYIFVYCKKGIRAGAAVDILKHLGYHNTVSLGGLQSS